MLSYILASTVTATEAAKTATSGAAEAVKSPTSQAAGTQANPETLLKPLLHWLAQHWLEILILVIALIVLTVIVIVAIKIIRRKIKNRNTAKELKEDLMLRKQLSTMAQGGSRGEKAEKEILHVRLGEIKSNFQYGTSLFKQGGKNIYDLPLYLLLGEPGAGKTEMMRYSGLDFPAGLVDLSQGESGTSSLHWWLSNDAAIIDVGGKVFFNRWGGQSDTEWGYLLRLIKKARPKLPLNGIILAIPADALLVDDEALVKKKASMISEELRTLQKATGLCLPVYVTITKMDQIVGFREFFMHLRGGQLEQMFGWSNPSPQGTYSAESMAQFFSEFNQHLKTYRSDLLLSPNLWEAGANRQRSQHASPLYAFPDAVHGLENNLANYLRTIFTPSQWGGKTSLMLQGIYFTSAVDKGAFFDPQHAKTLGKTVEEAPVKRMPDTGRHFFIKELFQNKVFKESGLVFFDFITRIKRRRPYIILSALAIICTLYFGLAMLVNRQYVKEIVKANTPDWELTYNLIKNDQLIKSPLIKKTPQKGKFALAIFEPVSGDTTMNREAYIKRQEYLSTVDINLPLNFYLASLPFGEFRNNMFITMREDIYQMVFSEMYFLPFVQGARDKFIAIPQTQWTKEANGALKTLLDIEYANAQRISKGQCDSCVKRFSLKSLSNFIYPNKYFTFNSDVTGAGRAYDISRPNSKLFHLLQAGTADSRIAIEKAIDSFCSSWLNGKAYPNLTVYKVSTLLDLLKKYRQTETAMLNMNKEIKDDILDTMTYDQVLKKRQFWLKELTKLKVITDKLDSLSAILNKEKAANIDILIDNAVNEYSSVIEKNFKEMISITEKSKLESAKEFFDDIKAKLKRTETIIQNRLNKKISELNQEITQNTPQIWTKAKDSDERDYQLKTTIYSSTASLSLSPEPITSILMLRDRITINQDAVVSVNNYLKGLSQNQKYQNFSNTITVCQNMTNLTKRLNTYSLVASALNIIPSTASKLRDKIAEHSPKYPPISSPVIPLTKMDENFTYNPQFNPMVVQNLMEEFAEIKDKLNISGKTKLPHFKGDQLTRRFYKVEKSFDTYLMEYIDYWSRDVLIYGNVSKIKSWQEFQKSALMIKSYQVNGALISLYNQCLDALLNLKLKKDSRLDSLRNQDTKYFQDKLLLLNETFNATCIQTLAAWATLPNHSTDAYSTIISLSPKNILANYLAVYSTDEKSRIPWWCEYIKTGVICLKDLINKKFHTDIRKISANMMYFPLCNTPDRRTILSPEEIADECDLLYKSFAFNTLKSKTTQTKKEEQAKTEPKPATNKLLSDIGLIQELNESISFKTKAQMEWWKKISVVINVLNNRDKPLTWTLIVPGKEVANKVPQFATQKEFTPAQERFRYFEVYSKGVRLGERMSTFSSTGKPTEQTAVTEFASAEDLNIVFFQNVDDVEPGAVKGFNGQWGAINLFLRPDVWYDQKLKAFIIPMSFTDKSGYNCYYWIGLKFNRNVPPPSAWPTLEDWIDFSPFHDSKKTAFELNRYFAKLVSDGKLDNIDDKTYEEIVNNLKSFSPYNSKPVFKFYLPSLRQQKTKIMHFMGEQTKQQQFTATEFPLPDAGVTLMRYMEILVDGKQVGKRMKTVKANGLEEHNTGIVLPATKGKIEFRFYEFLESEKPEASVTLPGPYAILKLMALPNRTKNPKDFSYMLPLFLEQLKGVNYFYWIGVSLDYQYAVPPNTEVQLP